MGLYLYAPMRGYNFSMPKINVYLPDDLAEAVRETDVPVSAICQRALEQAVRRITVIRQAVATDLIPADGDLTTVQMHSFTAKAVTAVRLGISRAHEASEANVGTADLWGGILAEGDNLALKILSSLQIDPAKVPVTLSRREPGGDEDGLRFSKPASIALEFAVSEAVSLGHNYVGCEHLLLGLAAEPDGVAGKALREAGADLKTLRQTVVTALAGYAYMQAQSGSAKQLAPLLAAVRQEMQPLVQRIERLEARLN